MSRQLKSQRDPLIIQFIFVYPNQQIKSSVRTILSKVIMKKELLRALD